MTAGNQTYRVPKAAAWLGGLGVLPFAGLAFTILVSDGLQRSQLSFALLTYGATILSFLGGIRWGLAIADTARADGESELLRRLIVSVIPSLIGWCCLLVPTRLGEFLLAAAFVAMLILDIRAAKAGQTPQWYPKLRWPLSCGAVLALTISGFAQ